jgi:hypothetical protein
VAKRGGRYYLLGEWLLQWIREGEIGHCPEAHKSNGRHVAKNGQPDME